MTELISIDGPVEWASIFTRLPESSGEALIG